MDVSRSLDENDEKIINLVYNKNTVILLNKSDLKSVVTREEIEEKLKQITDKKGTETREIPMLEVSAKEEQGIDVYKRQAFNLTRIYTVSSDTSYTVSGAIHVLYEIFDEQYSNFILLRICSQFSWTVFMDRNS